MKKIQQWMNQRMVKWRYGNEYTEDMIKISKPIKSLSIGLILIIVSSVALYKMASPVNYESVSVPPDEALHQLDTADEKDLTIVFYRSDCSACQRVEKELAKEIKAINDKGNRQIYVTNLQDMTNEQLQYIQTNLPEIMVDGTKIPTPLVANLHVNSEGIINVLEKSDTGDMDAIRRVLK